MATRYGTRGAIAKVTGQGPRTTKRLQPDSPLHMTTRAAGRTSQTSQSASPSGSIVSQTIGGPDLDATRPSKRIKASPSPPPPTEENIASSPLSSPAADAPVDSYEGYNSDVESQDIRTADDEGDLGTRYNDGYWMSEEEEDFPASQRLSPVAPLSGLASPGVGESRQTSPARSLRSPTKAKERLARAARAINGTHPDRLSPEPDEHGGLLKRLPGRRRAHHPDLDIEVDLRRQLELKVAYRAIAKALKPVLSELAERTARELDDDAALHQSYPEYHDIVTELDRRFELRSQVIEASLQQEEERLKKDHAAKQFILQSHCKNKLRDLQDDFVVRCQHQALETLRAATRDQDSDATEDEDDLLPPLYRMDMSTQTREKLPPAYDSRSRWHGRISTYMDDLAIRTKLEDEQRRFDDSSITCKPKGFATHDGKRRETAIGKLNILQLTDAIEEVEERNERNTAIAKQMEKDLSFEAVTGLHALTDAINLTTVAPQPHPMPQILQSPSQKSGPTGPPDTSLPKITTPARRFQPSFSHHSGQRKSSSRRKKEAVTRELYMPFPIDPYHGLPVGYDAQAYYSHYGWARMFPDPSAAILTPRREPMASETTSPTSRMEMTGRNMGGPHRQDFHAHSTGPALPTETERKPPVAEHRSDVVPSSSDTSSTRPTQAQEEHEHYHRTWSSLNNHMRPPLHVPNHMKEKSLIRPISPAASPLPSATTPSKPTEWPGFQTASSTHARTNSFDTRMSQMSAFPRLGPPLAPERHNSISLEENKKQDIINKDRRSASSPETMTQVSHFPPSRRESTHASPSLWAGSGTNASRKNSFAGFADTNQASVTGSAVDGAHGIHSTYQKDSPNGRDPRQQFRPPIMSSTPPLHSPATSNRSPRTYTGLAEQDDRKSRPSSPQLPTAPWSPKPFPQYTQLRPHSRTASPLSVAQVPHYEIPGPLQPNRLSNNGPSRVHSLQPYPPQHFVQHNRPGQHVLQHIAPAPTETRHRVGNAAPTATKPHGPTPSFAEITRRANTSAYDRPPMYNPREPPPNSSQTHTGVFRLGSEPFAAYPTLTQPYQYPPHPPQQSQTSGSSQSVRSRSRNKEPRLQGQLRWQHYIDMPGSSGAGATKSMNPAGPSTAASVSAPRYPEIQPAPAETGPARPLLPLPRTQSAESTTSGQVSSVGEKKQPDAEMVEEKGPDTVQSEKVIDETTKDGESGNA